MMRLRGVVGRHVTAEPFRHLRVHVHCALGLEQCELAGRHPKHGVGVGGRAGMLPAAEHPRFRDPLGSGHVAEGLDHLVFHEMAAVKDRLAIVVRDELGVAELFVPQALFRLIRRDAHQNGGIGAADADMAQQLPFRDGDKGCVKEHVHVGPLDPVGILDAGVEEIDQRDELGDGQAVEMLRAVIKNLFGQRVEGGGAYAHLFHLVTGFVEERGPCIDLIHTGLQPPVKPRLIEGRDLFGKIAFKVHDFPPLQRQARRLSKSSLPSPFCLNSISFSMRACINGISENQSSALSFSCPSALNRSVTA